MATMDGGDAWAGAFEALMGRLGPRFGRVEPRRRLAAYLRGLLAPVERKNGWQLAEAAGDRTPDGVQEFLSRVRWDAEAVRDDLQAYVALHLGDSRCRAGAGRDGLRQEGGEVGRGAAAILRAPPVGSRTARSGCSSPTASRYGRTLIDRALYLPESWAGNQARRREAGIPDAVGFLTKPKLGLAMLERAHAAGLPFAWVTADSVYGADHSLRRWLQEKELGYVLAVTRAQRLGFDRVEEHASEVPPGSWHRLSAGDGAKGPRLYDWAYAPYGSDAAPGWEKGLLIRRSLVDPGDLAFYLTHARHGMALAEFVQVAGSALDDRGLLRGGQRRGRPRPVRGPVLDRLAPPRNARHARPRLSRRPPQDRRRGTSPIQTWPPSCSPSPSRSCAVCSGISSFRRDPPSRPSSPGRAGDDGTSNAPVAPIGADEPPMKHGCSTRAFSRGPWIAGVDEVVGALGGREQVQELANGIPQAVDGALGSLAQQRFELGERLLDRVQVR